MKIISAQTASEDIHRVKEEKSQPGSRKIPRNEMSQIACKLCARRHPQRKEKCPAWGKECLKCGGGNHFAKVCRRNESRGGTEVHGAMLENRKHESDTDTSDVEYLGSVAIRAESVGQLSHLMKFIQERYRQGCRDRWRTYPISCGLWIFHKHSPRRICW